MAQKKYSCGETAKVKLMEPYAHIHGKIAKKSDIVLAVVNGNQSIHRISPRDLINRPLTQDELTARAKFSVRTKEVAARLDSDASTYMQDLASFSAARLNDGYVGSFKQWLWDQVKAKNA